MDYSLCQRILAELTADTRLLEATKRNLGVECVRAVDPCGTGVQPVRDAECLIDVFAEHGRGKTVVRVVRLPNDVFFVVELHNDADGTEDLLTHDLHVRVRVREDRGLDEVALSPEALTTKMQCCSILDTGVNVAHDTLRNCIGHHVQMKWLKNKSVHRTGSARPEVPGTNPS